MATIIADARERHGAIPHFDAYIEENNKEFAYASHKQGGGKLNLLIQNVTVGDYSIVLREGSENILAMVIERKTWKDLAGSIRDRRIHHQHKNLEDIRNRRGCFVLYLIEGPILYKDSLAIGAKSLKKKTTKGGIPFKNLHAKVRHNLLRGIPYVMARDEMHTAKLIVDFARDLIRLYREGEISFPKQTPGPTIGTWRRYVEEMTQLQARYADLFPEKTLECDLYELSCFHVRDVDNFYRAHTSENKEEIPIVAMEKEEEPDPDPEPEPEKEESADSESAEDDLDVIITKSVKTQKEVTKAIKKLTKEEKIVKAEGKKETKKDTKKEKQDTKKEKQETKKEKQEENVEDLSNSIDQILDNSLLIPDDLQQRNVRENSDIIRDMWCTLPGISDKSAPLIMEKYRLVDILCADKAALQKIVKDIALMKFASGIRIGEAKANKIMALHGKDSRAVAAKILSQIPGLSENVAEIILDNFTLKQLCAHDVLEDDLANLKKNEKARIGPKLAERILSTLSS